MPQPTIEHLYQLLREAESTLDRLTIENSALPPHASFELRAEYATYLRELNQTAAVWQAQTQQLLQILSDHPGLAVPPPPPELAGDESILDRTYTRCTLAVSWERQSPLAFRHAGVVQQLTRASFREVYRQVLADLVVRLRGELGARCMAYQGAQRIAVTQREGVYNHAVFRTDGYIFNIQLSAESIRASVASLYDIAGLSLKDFVVWVK